MANKKPLTNYSGTIKELQSGDKIAVSDISDVSATSRVLGRKTAGAGAIEELTLSEIMDFIGSATSGDILYRGASAWARLAKGSDGQVLTLASGLPSWAAGGGTTFLKSAYSTGEFATTSGTYVDVTNMSIAVEANKKYAITFQCYFDPQGTSAGMKIALSLPTSYTLMVGKRIVEGGGIGSMNDITDAPAQIFYSGSTAGYYIFWGFLHNGANAGNVKVQILSNTGGSSVRLYLARVLTVEEMQ